MSSSFVSTGKREETRVRQAVEAGEVGEVGEVGETGDSLCKSRIA